MQPFVGGARPTTSIDAAIFGPPRIRYSAWSSVRFALTVARVVAAFDADQPSRAQKMQTLEGEGDTRVTLSAEVGKKKLLLGRVRAVKITSTLAAMGATWRHISPVS